MLIKKALLLSFLIGCCDVTTGLLLISNPSLTLSLMQIQQPPSELVYLQFIGIFVFSVGFLYLLPLISSSESKVLLLRYVWQSTAIIRTAVALFVSVSVLHMTLAPAWISVAITDGVFAVLQLVLLKRGISGE